MKIDEINYLITNTFNGKQIKSDLIKNNYQKTFIHAEDQIDAIYLLISGTCEIHVSTENDITISDTLKAPQLFGLSEYFVNKDKYGATVFSKTNCQIIKIPIDLFQKTLDNYPELYKPISKYLAHLATRNMDFLELRNLLSNKQRFAKYIIELVKEPFPFKIEETREEIATKLHLNVRTIHRYIEEFKNANYLTINNRKIYILKDQYQKLLNNYNKLS